MPPLFRLAAVCLLAAGAASAQLPDLVLPAGVGVNIHFLHDCEKDLDLVAQAGFRVVRRDFNWAYTEKALGQYNFAPYDALTAGAEKRGIRLLYILSYSNPLYEPDGASPQHPDSVAAFAKWAGAAAAYFRGRHVIWEIWNEPNNPSWKPKPDPQQYAALALAACKAIRAVDSAATVIAPAAGYVPFPYLEPVFKSGLLREVDAVSVHPYPPGPPEIISPDYKKLHDLIARYAPSGKNLPIVSSEWGYSTFKGPGGGVTPEVQAQYLVRQQLWNLTSGIPLSIWYDWQDNGTRETEPEDNFGLLRAGGEPKPAFAAIQSMTRELAGFRLVRRLEAGTKKDVLLLLRNPQNVGKLAFWTTGEPHKLRLPGTTQDIIVTAMPQYAPARGAGF